MEGNKISSKIPGGLLAVVKYDICCNKANKKRKQGSGVCNAKGSHQLTKHLWLSTLSYLFFLFCVYCLSGYLSRKFSSAKERLILVSEGNLRFTKSVFAKILRSHAYVPPKRELRDQSDRSSS